MALKTLAERRRLPRVEFQGRVELDIPQSQVRLEANSLNLSEAGVCVRLQKTLDIRLRVKLRLFPETWKRPLECTGRVAWVVQRLDLRDSPPFLYDVGLEFLDPPQRFRQLAIRSGVQLKPVTAHPATPTLQPALLNGRRYVPRLEKESSAWHLVVWVDGVPCFSRRFPLQREAVESWQQFKRQAASSLVRAARLAGRPFLPGTGR